MSTTNVCAGCGNQWDWSINENHRAGCPVRAAKLAPPIPEAIDDRDIPGETIEQKYLYLSGFKECGKIMGPEIESLRARLAAAEQALTEANADSESLRAVVEYERTNVRTLLAQLDAAQATVERLRAALAAAESVVEAARRYPESKGHAFDGYIADYDRAVGKGEA